MTLTPVGKSANSKIQAAKKGVLAFGDKMLIPVGTGVTAGVIANQLPQNQRSSKKALKEIAKSDPYFNSEVAEKVFDLVAKMDDDEAEMFALFTLAEMHEDDIERNQRTLQSHINKVAAKRIERVQKALLNVVSKGADSEEAKAYAEALAEIKKAYQNPYTTGAYHFEESDFRRDRTGRFQAKITVDPSKRKPLPPKQAENLGIKVGGDRYNKMTPAEKARYQQEYMQIANFLNVVAQSGQLGDHDVKLQVRNKRSGLRHWVDLQGNMKPRPKMSSKDVDADAHWDPKTEVVESIDARPTGLTLGGAAFGLTSSLGRNQAAGLNYGDEQFGSFADDWTNPASDPYNHNQRLYSRVATSSGYLTGLGEVTGNQKLQIAGKLGTAVGSHGPEAEKVFGPAARKTAYRYRGTEKTPDSEVVRAYEMTVGRGEKPVLTEDQTKRLAARQNRAVSMLKTKRAESQGRPVEAVKLSTTEVAAERKRVSDAFMEQLAHKPDPEMQRKAVLQVLGQHLTDRERKGVPDKDYYNLQLKSGNTPPSEGFLLDKNGKVVTQAIGYGDDHYLPFNLKHLKKLRGGEYIRSRSVGGPTSEDIYTGLMAGAKRVTVVSRSGTFTVEFESDFKGTRRYNDKARRMTRRYERLLDTVQSETVARPINISPLVRQRLVAEVEDEAGALRPREKRELLKQKVEEYKSDLKTEDRDDFMALVEESAHGLNEDEAKKYRYEMMQDWHKNNEFQYRLNGVGYGAALDSLQEQFPYYIKTSYDPRNEVEFAREKDQGYVEPGRNRPTAAKGGWYGTEQNPGMKFSASHADYQRGRYHTASDAPTTSRTGGRKVEQAEEPAKEEINVPGGNLKPVEVKIPEERVKELNQAAEANYLDAAVNLVQEIQRSVDYQDSIRAMPVLGMTNEANIRQFLKDPTNVMKMEESVTNFRNTSGLPPSVTEALDNFKKASGLKDRVAFDPKLALSRKGSPMLFPDQASQPGADPSLAEAKAQEIATRTKPVSSSALSLAEMTDEDLTNEILVLSRVKAGLDNINGLPLEERTAKMREYGIDTGISGVSRILSVENIDRHAKDVQHMRALNLNRGQRSHAPVSPRVNHLPPRPEQQTLGVKEDASKHISVLEGAAAHLEKVYDDGSMDPVANSLRNKASEFKRMVQAKEVDEGAYGVAWREGADEIMLAHAIMDGNATAEDIEAYRDRLEP